MLPQSSRGCWEKEEEIRTPPGSSFAGGDGGIFGQIPRKQSTPIQQPKEDTDSAMAEKANSQDEMLGGQEPKITDHTIMMGDGRTGKHAQQLPDKAPSANETNEGQSKDWSVNDWGTYFNRMFPLVNWGNTHQGRKAKEIKRGETKAGGNTAKPDPAG